LNTNKLIHLIKSIREWNKVLVWIEFTNCDIFHISYLIYSRTPFFQLTRADSNDISNCFITELSYWILEEFYYKDFAILSLFSVIDDNCYYFFIKLLCYIYIMSKDSSKSSPSVLIS